MAEQAPAKNYCIIRMRKVPMTSLTASQIHNERLTNRHSNADIDIAKSHKNIIYYRTKNLAENVKKRIAEIQAKQKRKIRKDAPVAIEYMITFSPDAMSRLSENQKSRYWQKSLKFVELRHGINNRLSAVLHLDETTPHLHVLVFPEKNGKLSARDFFKLPALSRMQDEFAQQVGIPFGFERGVKYSELAEKGEKPHRHKSLKQYKAEKLKEAETRLQQIKAEQDKIAQEPIPIFDFEAPKKDILESREVYSQRTEQAFEEQFSPQLNALRIKAQRYEQAEIRCQELEQQKRTAEERLQEEKSKHEETKKTLETLKTVLSKVIRGFRFLAEKYLPNLRINQKTVKELSDKELENALKSLGQPKIQTKNRQTLKQSRGMER